MAQRSLSRRALLTGFFRGSADPVATRERSVAHEPVEESLVEAHRRVLRSHAQVLPWGVPAFELVAPLDVLREALLEAALAVESPSVRAELAHAYSSLPWFCSPEDLAILRAGKAAIESKNYGEAQRETIVRAYEVRGRILEAVARSSREFEQRLRHAAASVRVASVEDAAAIAPIHVAAWQAARRGLAPRAAFEGIDLPEETARWREMVQGPEGFTFVACAGVRAVGFCRVLPGLVTDDDAKIAEIASLEVVPAEWRRGYGRRLCGRVLDELAGRGFTEVTVWALERSQPAAGFLEACGFSRDGAARADATVSDGEIREVRYRRTINSEDDSASR